MRVEVIKRDGMWWCVVDGQYISDHRLRDGAVNAANAHLTAAPTEETTNDGE